jgi:hypothetical protein
VIARFGLATSAGTGESASEIPLSWDVQGATRVRLERLPAAAESPRAFQVVERAEYQLVAENGAGQASRAMTLYVLRLPVIEGFGADAVTIPPGGTVRLNWQTDRGEQIFLDDQPVGGGTGVQEIQPDGTREYVLRVVNAAGEASRRVQVVVRPPDTPTPTPLPTATRVPPTATVAASPTSRPAATATRVPAAVPTAPRSAPPVVPSTPPAPPPAPPGPPDDGVSGPARPVLAWYYPQFSQGWPQDVATAQRAGVDALIVSQTTQRPGVPLFTSPIARAAEGTNLAFTLGIETNVVYSSQEQLVNELKRILRDEAPNPRFLRYRGRPVIVFWQLPAIKTLPGQSPQEAWASVRAQVDPDRTSFWIAEGADPAPGTGTISYLASFEALHLFSIAWDAEPGRALASWAQRTRTAPGNKLWAATVMPGGFYADGPGPWKDRDRENGAYFEKAWRGALATNPAMVILTSLNEDNEASSITPRPAWGDLYVDINRRFSDQYHAGR